MKTQDTLYVPPSKKLAHTDLIRGQSDAYERTTKACLAKLASVWQDLELSIEEQVSKAANRRTAK